MLVAFPSLNTTPDSHSLKKEKLFMASLHAWGGSKAERRWQGDMTEEKGTQPVAARKQEPKRTGNKNILFWSQPQ